MVKFYKRVVMTHNAEFHKFSSSSQGGNFLLSCDKFYHKQEVPGRLSFAFTRSACLLTI